MLMPAHTNREDFPLFTAQVLQEFFLRMEVYAIFQIVIELQQNERAFL